MDDNLSRILKHLRKEFAAGNADLNKKKITMDAARVGVRLAPCGSELRVAIEAACDGNLTQYVACKIAQLERLGFEALPYEGTMTIHAGSNDGLIDTLLGLKTDVPISNLQSYETRFGIKLPLEKSEAGTITIQPSRVDGCTLAIRRNALEAPVVFRGDMFIPAISGLPREQFKFLLKFQLFSITRNKKFEILQQRESYRKL